MTIKVLVADDHDIVRIGVRSILEADTDIEVVAEATNGRDAVTLAEELSPDVVIMDVSMPDLNGIEATRQIVRRDPNAKVIALSIHSSSQYVKAMLDAGAIGYLLKDSVSAQLVRAVRAVASGQPYLDPDLARRGP